MIKTKLRWYCTNDLVWGQLREYFAEESVVAIQTTANARGFCPLAVDTFNDIRILAIEAINREYRISKADPDYSPVIDIVIFANNSISKIYYELPPLKENISGLVSGDDIAGDIANKIWFIRNESGYYNDKF